MDDPLSKTRASIQRYGWHCIGVLPKVGDEDVTPFAYTVGLVETLNHPELALFGLDFETAHGILAVCVDLIRAQGPLPVDQPVPEVLGDDFDVLLRPMRRERYAEYLGGALRYYGRGDFDALVVFWPDPSGRFPWETEEYGLQSEAMTLV